MKITKILLVLVLTLSLTGCLDKVSEEAEKLQDDVTKAYGNNKEEVEEVSKKVTDTVNKIEETANDIEEAKKAVEEVVK